MFAAMEKDETDIGELYVPESDWFYEFWYFRVG